MFPQFKNPKSSIHKKYTKKYLTKNYIAYN